MPEFDTAHVKNIVLLGHAGCGKTTLTECMLFEAGLVNRRGTVADRNTTADYHELEQERGNSIFSKLLHTKWRGYKINIIDTPGYDDFTGEVLSALRLRKDQAEVEAMRRAVKIAQDALEATIPLIKIGMTEKELSAESHHLG